MMQDTNLLIKIPNVLRLKAQGGNWPIPVLPFRVSWDLFNNVSFIEGEQTRPPVVRQIQRADPPQKAAEVREWTDFGLRFFTRPPFFSPAYAKIYAIFLLPNSWRSDYCSLLPHKRRKIAMAPSQWKRRLHRHYRTNSFHSFLAYHLQSTVWGVWSMSCMDIWVARCILGHDQYQALMIANNNAS